MQKKQWLQFARRETVNRELAIGIDGSTERKEDTCRDFDTNKCYRNPVPVAGYQKVEPPCVHDCNSEVELYSACPQNSDEHDRGSTFRAGLPVHNVHLAHALLYELLQ
jgi:hypothetical protein